MGVDWLPAFESFVQGFENSLGLTDRFIVAVNLQKISATGNLHLRFGFDLCQIPIVFAAQPGEQTVVGKLECAITARRLEMRH